MHRRNSAVNRKNEWQIPDTIEATLIAGGGIMQPEKVYLNCKAGADVTVVGNAIEKDVSLIQEMSDAVHSVPVNA
jgi:heptaprenylglyceryl phosphate synthase